MKLPSFMSEVGALLAPPSPKPSDLVDLKSHNSSIQYRTRLGSFSAVDFSIVAEFYGKLLSL